MLNGKKDKLMDEQISSLYCYNKIPNPKCCDRLRSLIALVCLKAGGVARILMNNDVVTK